MKFFLYNYFCLATIWAHNILYPSGSYCPYSAMLQATHYLSYLPVIHNCLSNCDAIQTLWTRKIFTIHCLKQLHYWQNLTLACCPQWFISQLWNLPWTKKLQLICHNVSVCVSVLELFEAIMYTSKTCKKVTFVSPLRSKTLPHVCEEHDSISKTSS